MNIDRRGKLAFGDIRYISGEIPLTLRNGDIVFNNTNSRELVGKSALFNLSQQWAFSNHITRLRDPEMELRPEFLQYQLLFLWRCGYFRSIARQHVNQASISSTRLGKEVLLFIAPLEDQSRLIETIGNKFTTLSSIDGSAKRALETLTIYETETLRRTAEGISASTPGKEEAVWITIEEAGGVQLGKMRTPESSSGVQNFPCLRVANVLEDRIDTSDVNTMHFSDQEFEKYRLVAGDVLLNEGQSPELVGRPAMFQDELPNCCFQKSLLRFRANPNVSPRFALLVFRHYLRSGTFQAQARWTTNLANLTAARFKKMPFPLYSLANQYQLVDHAEVRLSNIISIRQRLESIFDQIEAAWTATLREGLFAEEMPVQENAEGEVQSSRTVNTRHSPPTPRSLSKVSDLTASFESHEDELAIEDVFHRAGYSGETIDDFFASLRELVGQQSLEEVRVDDTVFLRKRTQ